VFDAGETGQDRDKRAHVAEQPAFVAMSSEPERDPGETLMRILVLGAGAVVCYYGGLLARNGHDVTFIGRAAHVEAIRTNGLVLEIAGARQVVPAKAASGATGIEEPDLVLVCVKSADTEAAAHVVAGHLPEQSTVVSLQNGVDNAERFGAIADRVVVPAIVYVGTEMAGPGHVRHHGRGELSIGPSAQSPALADLFCSAGIPTDVVENFAEAQWIKLVVNCAYNALSAVANIAYGPMMEVDGARTVIANTVAECSAVANACGIELPDDILAQTLALAGSMPHQKSSTAQDLVRRKPSEIDFLNGFIVRKGIERGVPTPTNLALQVMVKLAEKAASASIST
jgi:2-dehydropantoate 2-reductase